MRAAPEDHRFHAGTGLLGYLVALSTSIFLGSIIVTATGYSNRPTREWPLGLIVANQAVLWISFVAVVLAVSRWWGTASLRRDFGLEFKRRDTFGVVVGAVLQLVFVPVLYWVLGPLYRWLLRATGKSWFDVKQLEEPAKDIAGKANGALGAVVLFAILAIGAPMIEELFFRGLVLRSFQARNHDALALWGSSLLFAAGHFQALQFPALLMFGLVAGSAAQRSKRLGPAIWVHVGFNATTTLLLLADA